MHHEGKVVSVTLPPGTEINVDGEFRDSGLERVTARAAAFELVVPSVLPLGSCRVALGAVARSRGQRRYAGHSRPRRQRDGSGAIAACATASR